jgi:hypothetical protein
MTVDTTGVAAPSSSVAERRARAARLVQAGRLEESLPLWREEVSSGVEGATWVRAAAVEAMAWRDLTVAGTLAQLYATATWGSRWFHGPAAGAATTVPAQVPRNQLSLPKLRHDIDQFRYLRDHTSSAVEYDELIGLYAQLAERLEPAGIEARLPLTGEDEARVGHVYNRIVHLADAPRLDHALSRGWDPGEVEERYLEPPGVVVIDDFLSPAALEKVRRFCLESTVWSGTRYSEGRLGAFFVDGFSAPLLLQIAEEVRARFPRLIGDRHPLRQFWAFKNAPRSLGGANTHADFAAVNVNFWVTPTDSNLDPDSGGLVVYDVTAPLSWSFRTYNERPDLIRSYLREQGARAIRIPYRANRAIVFNSDLFHATEPIHFRPEYEHRRLNITMLYGDRADDRHHPSANASTASGDSAASAWRSSALSRTRR